MALKKAITTEEGFTVEYWVVSDGATINFRTGEARVNVVAYKDAQAKADGKRPVDVRMDTEEIREARRLTLSGAKLTAALATGDLRPAFYAEAKTKAFFEDAEDV